MTERPRVLRLYYDDTRDIFYAAIGRYVTFFNRLEVDVHELVGDLLKVDPRRRTPNTSDLQLGGLLPHLTRLWTAAEAAGIFENPPRGHSPDLITQLRAVNEDRRALVHSVHDLGGQGGMMVRQIVTRKDAPPTFEERLMGAWPVERIVDAYERASEAMVAVNMERGIVITQLAARERADK